MRSDDALQTARFPSPLPVSPIHRLLPFMEPLLDRLALVDKHISRAVSTTDADPHASPVTRAVVREFHKKMQKARDALTSTSTPRDRRDAVIEVEQAGDSANVAAIADTAASDDTRKAVDLAHKAMCLLKHEGGFDE